MRSTCLFTIFAIIFILSVLPATATTGNEETKPPAVTQKTLPKPSITHHSLKLEKSLIQYRAEAGYMPLKDEKDQHRASLFFIAYTQKGQSDPGQRPVTFVFNGGPGSASLWLHMGGLGPRRVVLSEEGFSIPQPFAYRNNPYSWLEFTDLVFIDPIGTSYSRPAPGVEGKEFFGLDEDVRWVAEFIRLYITKNKRWLSPKYICGESYGTTRAAALSNHIQERYGMYLQGLVLVSSIMQFQTARFVPGNDLPPAVFLPTYTATAWYHKKLPPQYQGDLQTTLREVEQWALTGYWTALARGDRLTQKERNEVIHRLASYTGLSKEYIDRKNLRIEIFDFIEELLGTERHLVGRLDSRFKTPKPGDDTTEVLLDDPSYTAIAGPFTATINHYIRGELNYINDITYWPFADVSPWNWGKRRGFVNVAESLRAAMLKNSNLNVLIANGYYDLATPYFATDYTVNHLALPPERAAAITMKYYEAGHMMYIRDKSLKKLHDDVREFYRQNAKK